MIDNLQQSRIKTKDGCFIHRIIILLSLIIKVVQSQELNRDVSNLRLEPGSRSVKLSWTYKSDKFNQPTTFAIYFCELTSWNMRINCCQKEISVQNDTKDSIDNDEIKSVIELKKNPHLLSLENSQYETEIFNLRALTNYTFDVKVLHFKNDRFIKSNGISNLKDSYSVSNRSNNHINLIDKYKDLSFKVETKPFKAEATKCLSDASEVLINTGRFFGGRISVENNQDPRCSINGNKSSENATYLFHIDHEICKSRVVDDKRIETMILVHENKDILTHNAARFLVLCNFLQKSFTLKASISLPRVNSLINSNRPAMITSLQNSKFETPIKLGSMPGLYRAKNNQIQSKSLNKTKNFNNNSELNSNLIETSNKDDVEILNMNEIQRRQSKNMDIFKESPSSQVTKIDTSIRILPQPVNIQSKMLRVIHEKTFNVISASPIDNNQFHGHSMGRLIQSTKQNNSNLAKQEKNFEELETEPIILVNNHRALVDFRPLAQLQQSNSNNSNFSIKYSTAQIDEFPTEITHHINRKLRG